MSAYGPFELAPLEAVIVPDVPTGNGTKDSTRASHGARASNKRS